jgi:maltooligosyltrehalose trehalohydrolase
MELSLGSSLKPDQVCDFLVWAPSAAEVQLHLVSPVDKVIPMKRENRGYFSVRVPDLRSGARYFFKINGATNLPDPASRFQPDGVHGPSEVVDTNFEWTDQGWLGLLLRDYVIYELHVGTFSSEGTFDAVIPYLAELKALGITAIELMPVAQFPGKRNWGYDGVGLYAVQNSYGGPQGLKRLVNAAHGLGMAMILDVVYNHLGPEGNYLEGLAPYFTDTYKTPWGQALNFDGAHSDGVRHFFIQNALYWQTEFHFDALRLDAVHAIRDISALPFLRELKQKTTARAEKLNRPFHLIGEMDLNAPRFILPEAQGGYGLDAQWADDFHHCLHVLLTGEQRGYYQDYTGGLDQFAKVWREGYAFTGEYSPYRKAHHGQPSDGALPKQFVVCAQNHDQVGNRMTGDRLSNMVDFESLKLAASCVLLSPFTPLLFMGEEYGETAPFQYMVDHGDKDLLQAVQNGRREEFASFSWRGEVPDPASEAAFARSRLNHSLREKGDHQKLLRFYRKLLSIRKEYASIRHSERSDIEVKVQGDLLRVHYRIEPQLILLFSFAPEDRSPDGIQPESWTIILDSASAEWGGPNKPGAAGLKISPRSALVLSKAAHSVN